MIAYSGRSASAHHVAVKSRRSLPVFQKLRASAFLGSGVSDSLRSAGKSCRHPASCRYTGTHDNARRRADIAGEMNHSLVAAEANATRIP